MYIPSNLYKIPVNPNVVSGADFDNNYSNYVMDVFGPERKPYSFNLPSVDDFIDTDDDELERIHKRIVQDKAEVILGEKALKEVNKKLMDLAPFLSTHSKEYGRLISLKQRGVITEPRGLAELDKKIAVEKKQKDAVRLRYSQLNSEASKLDTFINSRKQGSIYGLSQEFEAKAGRPYVPEEFNRKEVLIDEQEVINSETIKNEIDELTQPVLPNLPNENIVFDGVPPDGFKKETIIDKISNTVGVSKQNTKYGLIGLGVIAIVLIAKNR